MSLTKTSYAGHFSQKTGAALPPKFSKIPPGKTLGGAPRQPSKFNRKSKKFLVGGTVQHSSNSFYNKKLTKCGKCEPASDSNKGCLDQATSSIPAKPEPHRYNRYNHRKWFATFGLNQRRWHGHQIIGKKQLVMSTSFRCQCWKRRWVAERLPLVAGFLYTMSYTKRKEI